MLARYFQIFAEDDQLASGHESGHTHGCDSGRSFRTTSMAVRRLL